MTIQQIYEEYTAFNKPGAKWHTKDIEKLHTQTIKAINRIGNANPHWNKLINRDDNGDVVKYSRPCRW